MQNSNWSEKWTCL